jgi:serine/threonine-protein kinase haspin
MPPTKGYGKRLKPATAFFSHVFESSSPKKSREENTITNLTIGLESISLSRTDVGPKDPSCPASKPPPAVQTDSAKPTPPKPAPLKSRDPNIQKKPAESKAKAPRRAESEIRDADYDYLSPLLSLSLDPKYRTAAEPFEAWSSAIEKHFNIVKIAEASYGEVYRLVLKTAHASLATSDESVLKILALKPPPSTSHSKKPPKRHDFMSDVAAVASEAKLLQRMTLVPGFTNFRDVRVLRGRPSPAFCAAWTAFEDAAALAGRERSAFPDPRLPRSYPRAQLWAVVEMQDAGADLDTARLPAVWHAWDVFWAVALALAKGEQEAAFEHRDLHMGNICVKARREEAGVPLERVRVRELERKLGFTGIETTVIDYTLSRAEISEREAGDDDAEMSVEFLDLALEPGLFEADASDEYQYDIYRYMRSAMYFSDPLADYPSRTEEAARTGRTWAGFHPQTNLVWLHFVLHRLLAQVTWPSRNMRFTMQHVDVCGTEDERRARRKAKELEANLRQLKTLLVVKSIPKEGLASACDLVALSLDRGWLDEEDIVGDEDSMIHEA